MKKERKKEKYNKEGKKGVLQKTVVSLRKHTLFFVLNNE
jgi:hypothetical protein